MRQTCASHESVSQLSCASDGTQSSSLCDPTDATTFARPLQTKGVKRSLSCSFGVQEGSAAHGKYYGVAVSQLIFVEIFAGSARLSRAFSRAGFQTVAVDHKATSTVHHITMHDLTNPLQQCALIDFLRANKESVAFVHMAPPCGTASKARERPLPALAALGVQVPQPLRSLSHPDGVDGLVGSDKVRTELANMLYEAVEELAVLCDSCGILWSIENPWGSYFWSTTAMGRLQNKLQPKTKLVEVRFQNCCHGGDRDKGTMFWCNHSLFACLEARCDKSHVHKPWTASFASSKLHFATSDEAAYPDVLCARMSSIIFDYVVAQGAQLPEDISQQATSVEPGAINRILLGALPRGNRVRPLVSEFGQYLTVIAPAQCDEQVRKFALTCAKGTKVQHRRTVKWGDVRGDVQQKGWVCLLSKEPEVLDSYVVEKVVLGVPRRPEVFVQEALAAGHPRGVAMHLDELSRRVVMENRDLPALEIIGKRLNFIKHWLSRRQELAAKEEELHASLPGHAKPVLAGKCVLLMKEMLAALGYSDTCLAEHVQSGFNLTGWLPKTGVFDSRVKRPGSTVELQLRLAKGTNSQILAKLKADEWTELDDVMWDETMLEVEKGWISEDPKPDLERVLLAKRFCIRQGAKHRLIDDFTIGGLNDCCGMSERLRVQAVDSMAALVSFSLNVKTKACHPVLVGRTYDLSSAYKQYRVAEQDRELARLAVRSKGGGVRFFKVNALPFGAVGSVGGFLRVSAAIVFAAMAGLRICLTGFFDDFTVLSRDGLQMSAAYSMECLLDLWGVRFAREGHKAMQFDGCFRTLGLLVNLLGIPKGVALVGHTEERRTELAEALHAVIESGELSRKEAERLRGRLIWFESFVWGRSANMAVRELGRACSDSRGRCRVQGKLKDALSVILDRVRSGRPVEVTGAVCCTWLVFTDGACEGDTADKRGSIGGVLLDQHGSKVSFFSERVPAEMMSELQQSSANPIYELEILPLLVSLRLWGKQLAGSAVVFYLDNEAARSGFIRGTGATEFSDDWIKSFCVLEEDFGLRPWFGRVPTASNIADDPSREETEGLVAEGCSRIRVDWGAPEWRLQRPSR